MYKAPVAEIAHTLKHVAGMKKALEGAQLGDLSEDLVDAILEEAGRFATDEIAPLHKIGDETGAVLKDARRHHAARLEGHVQALVRGRLERARRSRGFRRAGPADDDVGGSARNVELRLHGLRRRADADHGRGRGDRQARLRRAQGDLSGKARHRRVDGHDEPDRAAGRLRPRRAAHPRRAGGRRHLPHLRPEDIHHLRRARLHRQHRAPGAGAPARRTARNARHLAVPGAEVPAERRRHARRAQRSVLCLARGEARHPRLADLRHGLWRRLREGPRTGRHRLAGRGRKSRARLHVHDDEQRQAGRRHAGRRGGRDGLPEGAGLCRGAPPGQGAGRTRARA